MKREQDVEEAYSLILPRKFLDTPLESDSRRGSGVDPKIDRSAGYTATSATAQNSDISTERKVNPVLESFMSKDLTRVEDSRGIVLPKQLNSSS